MQASEHGNSVKCLKTDDVAIEDGKSCSSDKDHCGDEPDFGRRERKMSRGSCSRKHVLPSV